MTASESRVLLRDLTSTTTIDVPRSVFESRAPSSLAVLYLNSSKLLAGKLSDLCAVGLVGASLPTHRSQILDTSVFLGTRSLQLATNEAVHILQGTFRTE